MPKFAHHLFICCNQRTEGHSRGCCDPEGALALQTRFKAELTKRGLKPLVRANRSGCLDQCELGPCMVIYPSGIWYGGVQLEDVERIVEETILKGRVLEDLKIEDHLLNPSKGCLPETSVSPETELK